MLEFLAIYIIVGGLVALPAAEELSFFQITTTVLTWPVVAVYLFLQFVKGNK